MSVFQGVFGSSAGGSAQATSGNSQVTLGGSFGLVGNRFAAHWLQGAPTGFSGSGFGGFDYVRSRQLMDVGPVAVTDVVFDWPNWVPIPGETDNTNPILLSAVIAAADGENFQVLWAGQPTIVIQPGVTAQNDPLPIVLLANTQYILTVHVSATIQGAGYPITATLSGTRTGEGWNSIGTSITDAANVPVLASDNLAAASLSIFQDLPIYAPCAMRGTIARAIPRLLILGDSISDGIGDNLDIYGGYIRRALGYKFPLLQLTAPGDSVTSFNAMSTRRARLLARCGATHCIYELGTNDFGGGVTFAALQYQAEIAWERLRARGMKIYACTLTPRTTSSDGFTTTSGQTLSSFEGYRVAYNTWIRAGADGLIDGFFDPAAMVETSLNSGLWNVTGGPFTADGIHPSAIGHAAASLAINTAVFVF